MTILSPRPLRWLRCAAMFSCVVQLAAAVSAIEPVASSPDSPPPADGVAEATKLLTSLRAPEGLKVELFAAEPMLGAPVAICLDEQNRVYVAEEYRFNHGAEENRSSPFLLEDDLQLQTTADRLAMLEKWAHKYQGGMAWFSQNSDQVRQLVDADGDGRADRSTVFAGGFNHPLDGLASGVLAYDGDIFLTCVPNLWRLRDTTNDGVADERQVIHSGFGVSASFLGHDLHGLTWGPDGKLYFSLGDRGFHVQTQEGQTLSGMRTGAVFRCYPDGSELEVVARGLRNPQELAFDDYGNLFADDNNCDAGDDARLVYVVEGGDSGWNMAYQTIAEPYMTGPWHAEKLWHRAHPGQPAWIVPSVGKIGTGPSGFTFYSGLGLPDRYQGHFFMVNCTGGGGVESFALAPSGAAFEIVDYHDFLKPLMATDVEFGYDGKVYVSDFVRLEWTGSSKWGRIYTVSDPAAVQQPALQQVRKLFEQGFKSQTDAQLVELLEHADRRVRQRAQFTLAERGQPVAEALQKLAVGSGPRFGRLHAIWGLGQIGRRHPQVLAHLEPLLADADAEVRAQVARVVGDNRYAPAAAAIVGLLRDDSLHVRLLAALALGKLKYPAEDAVFDMIRDNNDGDPFLRHAAVMALVGMDNPAAVQTRAKDPSPGVRMAVLLVERRRQDPQIAQFLDDADELLVTEAARAISDLPIESATGSLARLAARYATGATAEREPLVRRVIQANFRLGTAEHARAVLAFAASDKNCPAMRAEALSALGDWSNPPKRDRVTGVWRPLATRDPESVRQVVEPAIPQILAAATTAGLQLQAIQLFTKLNLRVDNDLFWTGFLDTQRPVPTRSAALRQLAARGDARLAAAIQTALADPDPTLRADGRDLLADLDRAAAMESLSGVLRDAAAAIQERQRALATLARLKSVEADALLTVWADALAQGQVPGELQIDVIEAVQQRSLPQAQESVERFQHAQQTADPLSPFRVSLLGGDADRGREIFVGHRNAQCMRCHTINGQGGVAGPDLTRVAARNDRDYLLQSLVDPDAKIATGFGSITLVLDSGKVVAGTLKSEEDGVLLLVAADGTEQRVPSDSIDERLPPKSPMPRMAGVLSTREMRDLIEYLSTLCGDGAGAISDAAADAAK